MRPLTENDPFTDPWHQIRALSLIVVCGLLGCFGTLQSPFHYDDVHAIVQNPYIANLENFQEAVGVQNIFNRSVLLFTFAVNREAGQLDVYGYHLVNILIHICVAVLFYFVTRNLILLAPVSQQSSYRNLPLAVALIHTFNPVAVESVAYISSRSSSLATLFYLLGFYFFQRYSNSKIMREGLGWHFCFLVLVCICFFLGLASKEIVITLPIMALVYSWMRSRQGLKDNIAGIGLSIFAICAYLAYRYIKLGSLLTLPADPSSQAMDRGLYLLTQFSVLAFYYFPKLAFPINLNFEPDVRLVTGPLDPQWILGAVLLLSLLGGLYVLRSRLFSFGICWMLITLLPTSSLIPLKQIASEHRTYLPALGISLCLGLIFVNRNRFSGMFKAGLVLFLLCTSLLFMHRGLDYRTAIQLWEDTARKSPNKALVHNNLATAYIPDLRYDEAIRELETTLKLDPDSADAYINLGFIHARREEWQRALLFLDQALLLGSERAEVYYNSGLVRERLSNPGAAIPFLQRAVELKPQVAEYHFQLGFALQQIGNRDMALKSFRDTLALEPRHLEALNNIGVIYWNLKAFDLAQEAFQQALSIDANAAKIHRNLGNVYMVQKNFGKAVYHLERYLALQPEDPKAQALLDLARTLAGTETP